MYESVYGGDAAMMAAILLSLAAIVLVWLAIIDLKLRLLPDELVLAFALLALPFQYVTHGAHLFVWWDMFAGCAAGGLFLWLIRAIGNRSYGFETMGLGDVKLMAAAGLWLGTQNVILALGLGAMCGVLHGIGVIAADRMHGKHTPFRGLTIPAGPGFIAGIVVIGAWHLLRGGA